ncbi:MAG: hypothetical protein ACFE8N_08250, partial [Promethearchaeota archaeon]
IDKEKIADWPIELQLKFVEDVRNKLKSYRDDKVEEEISKYLDEILNSIAIPKIKEIFKTGSQDEITAILIEFEELSEINAGAIRPIQPLLENLTKNTNKKISSSVQKIFENLEV